MPFPTPVTFPLLSTLATDVSSDLKYIYENEDGSFDIDLNGSYYGEVDYQMIYKNIEGEPFDWLYVDFPLLSTIAESNGLHAELIAEGEHYDYLARLTNF